MILLVDGDYIAFRAALGRTEEGEELHPVEAQIRCKNAMEYLRQELWADSLIVCMSDPDENFRLTYCPTYKHNRDKESRPAIIDETKAWLMDSYKARWEPGLEADDVQGILASGELKGKSIVCSIDKDLYQTPGLFYHTSSKGKVKGVQTITEDAALRFLWLQTLTGDTTDGYHGIPKCGPVKANKVIDRALATGDTLRELWPHVVMAYEDAGLSEDDAFSQYAAARILQAKDYDLATGRMRKPDPTDP